MGGVIEDDPLGLKEGGGINVQSDDPLDDMIDSLILLLVWSEIATVAIGEVDEEVVTMEGDSVNFLTDGIAGVIVVLDLDRVEGDGLASRGAAGED